MNALQVNNEILAKVVTLANQRELSTTDFLNEVIAVYEDTQNLQMFEKHLFDNEYKVITIHKHGVCIEDVTRHANVDSFSDLDLIINDGYYPIYYGKPNIYKDEL